MIAEFPKKDMEGTSVTPANDNLFKVNEHSPPLGNQQKESFHTMVAKGLFVGKRARQEIQTTIAFLCTRVQRPTKEDWNKLSKVMKFLNATQDDCLVLEYNGKKTIEWYVSENRGFK